MALNQEIVVNPLKIWAETTWETLLDGALKKALGQTGTDSLPAAVREAGFSAIDRAASTVLNAFAGSCEKMQFDFQSSQILHIRVAISQVAIRIQ